MLDSTGVRPLIDRELPMDQARDGFAVMAERRRLRQGRLHPMTRTHLLTGAGSGMGAVLAERLLERGDSLVLLARSTERAHDLRAELPDATVLVADLADAAAVEAVADQLPESLDSVVHAAGVVDLGTARAS